MNIEQLNYYYNLVKGRIAENITEEMFNLLGYTIERYGMENQLPSISKILRRYEKTASVKKIRNMPDFVIGNNNIGVRFLEVKYRYNRTLTKEHVENYKEYSDTIFLVFDSSQIYVTEMKKINFNGKNSICLESPFVDSDIFKFANEEKHKIISFIKLAKLFFNNLERNETAIEKIRL